MRQCEEDAETMLASVKDDLRDQPFVDAFNAEELIAMGSEDGLLSRVDTPDLDLVVPLINNTTEEEYRLDCGCCMDRQLTAQYEAGFALLKDIFPHFTSSASLTTAVTDDEIKIGWMDAYSTNGNYNAVFTYEVL